MSYETDDIDELRNGLEGIGVEGNEMEELGIDPIPTWREQATEALPDVDISNLDPPVAIEDANAAYSSVYDTGVRVAVGLESGQRVRLDAPSDLDAANAEDWARAQFREAGLLSEPPTQEERQAVIRERLERLQALDEGGDSEESGTGSNSSGSGSDGSDSGGSGDGQQSDQNYTTDSGSGDDGQQDDSQQGGNSADAVLAGISEVQAAVATVGLLGAVYAVLRGS